MIFLASARLCEVMSGFGNEDGVSLQLQQRLGGLYGHCLAVGVTPTDYCRRITVPN